MKRILLLYQYFHPDDVISAHHYSQLAEELSLRDWEVHAMPGNRARHDASVVFDQYENWNGIHIRRIWRPGFRQTSPFQRFCNAVWMVLAWCFAAFRKKTIPDVDAVVIGTDPILSILAAIVWKTVRPQTKTVHWCFDLFPETGIAAGFFRSDSLYVRIIKRMMKRAYRACDLIVDTGSCQRKRLQMYDRSIGQVTCTPWALSEPSEPIAIDKEERTSLFGDAQLALFYSGNIGMAYSFERFVELARLLREDDIKLVFGVRGARVDEIKAMVTPDDTNISFAPFAPLDRLQARLSAPDIHLVSLRQEFTGTLVPSKFFGSLAVGRPVIFEGSEDSAVSEWIRQYGLGWVLTPENMASIAKKLVELSQSPEDLVDLRQRCHHVYYEVFSKKIVVDLWDREIRKLMPACDSQQCERAVVLKS